MIPPLIRLAASAAVSGILHAAAYGGVVPQPHVRVKPPAPSLVDFSVEVKERPLPPPMEEPLVPEKAPVRPEQPTPRPETVRPAPRPEAPLSARGESSPIDLTGVTLTHAGNGDTFLSTLGSGQALDVRRPAPRAPVATASRSTSTGTAPPPRIVPLSDLSQRPTPPSLNETLRRNYPEDARRRGMEGTAVVRARVGPNGRLEALRVSSETAPSFGSACKKTLAGSRWSAPLDGSGQPVHTEITYVCRFRVDD